MVDTFWDVSIAIRSLQLGLDTFLLHLLSFAFSLLYSLFSEALNQRSYKNALEANACHTALPTKSPEANTIQFPQVLTFSLK